MILKVQIGASIIEADFILDDSGFRQVAHQDASRMVITELAAFRNASVRVEIRADGDNARALFEELERASYECRNATTHETR